MLIEASAATDQPDTSDTVTTFASTNGLLVPIAADFAGQPGRKTTQTESDG